MDIASFRQASYQPLESRIGRLESQLARVRSDIAEMNRREQLAAAARRLRRERVTDGIWNVLQAALLAIEVVALAHGLRP